MNGNGNGQTGGASGNSLKDRRIALGLSQERLARLAECSTSSVALHERGYLPKHPLALERIEQVLTEAENAMREREAA